ncbi:Uncharacterised protein [Edwardsiella hoshinae]|uniref:Uncharacterized protein n=1 Tax=Edwardsiella hoshinae TaxID=93378 RepID=A0A376DBB6_9GAMM|nr:Uncharacterised protein [Edwardsiella hoshinae]
MKNNWHYVMAIFLGLLRYWDKKELGATIHPPRRRSLTIDTGGNGLCG